MDISFGREMIGLGGVPMPTPADYLYRMLPAMEKLAQLRPQDLENRLRLGTAYRWNNDQLTAIATHEGVVKELPPGHPLRARALTELAWSRIAKVAWNRTFDDPGILEAYKEAQEAYKITERPLDKFTGAYTMAYSLAFTPNRDNHAMLELLSDARRWYMQIPGAKPERHAEGRDPRGPGLQSLAGGSGGNGDRHHSEMKPVPLKSATSASR